MWLVIGLWAAGVAPALAETRVALLIANSSYRHAPSLPNPPRDAAAMAAALRQVGFATVEVQANQGKAQMEAALRQFAAAARGADVALVYYAGHSMEQGGLNYLVPVDAALASDGDVAFETVPLKLVERSVEGATRLKLIVLDACRNNPFVAGMTRTSATRAIGRGLARVEPEGDILIAYAAREGAVASDGDGGNSPYTSALVRRLATPGLEIRILFGQVRDDVLKATARAQEPAIYGSLGGDPFYFVAPEGASSVTVKTNAPAGVDPAAVELAFWQSASAGGDRAQIQAYLDKYPRGEFASLAKAKLAAPTVSPPQAAAPTAGGAGARARVFGMTLSMLDDAARGRLGAPPGVQGAVVEAVQPGTEAAAQGVRAGDIITHIGGRQVLAPGAVFNITRSVAAAGKTQTPATIFREGRPQRLVFNIPAEAAGLKPPGARRAARSAPR